MAHVNGQTHIFNGSVHMIVVLSILFSKCGHCILRASQSNKMSFLAGSAVADAKFCIQSPSLQNGDKNNTLYCYYIGGIRWQSNMPWKVVHLRCPINFIPIPIPWAPILVAPFTQNVTPLLFTQPPPTQALQPYASRPASRKLFQGDLLICHIEVVWLKRPRWNER